MLRRDEKLESCGVRDGSTIQVTSRMRGRGKHKDKKSKAEKKHLESKEEAIIRMWEENEGSRKLI